MSEKELTIWLLENARQYTLGLLDGLEDDEWFAMPNGCPTHIAWQVGHITLAQFGVALARAFGTSSQDAGILPENYAELFGKGSQPTADRSKYPSGNDLRANLDRVHLHVLGRLRSTPEEAFGQPAAEPMLHLKTAGEVARFASLHEMTHAGQIGLIRRLLGKPPLR